MINQNILRIIAFIGFGFASGLPYVLIVVTLSAWLRDIGVDLSLIGFVTWVSLTYSLKFIWAPFVDRFSIPIFNRFGARRSWILSMQIVIFIFLLIISEIDPQANIKYFAFVAFIIALAGSIQDIAIDALRIESAEIEDQGNLAAGYQFGYRIAILVASSLALIIASNFSWTFAYKLMALITGLNVIITMIISKENKNLGLKRLNHIDTMIEPFKDFFERFGLKMAAILLLIIASYRLTDIVMGPMANPFYIDMGFTLSEIGYIVKVVALISTIVGVFVGGILIKKSGLYKSLLIGAFLVMITNLLFSYTAITDKNLTLLAFIVASDSLAAGIVGTVNITFLTSLVSQKYTGFQYALLTSVMTFTGTIFKGFSGVIVESFQSLYGFNHGWMSFYIFTSFLAMPAILLIMSKKGFFVKNDQSY